MAWKILSALTIICLGGAGYFAWEQKNAAKDEKQRLKLAEANLKAAQERKQELVEAKKTRGEELVALEKQRDSVKEAAAKLAVTAQEKETELGLAKSTLEQKAAQVTSLEKQIKDAGDIKSLVAQVAKLQQDEKAAQAELASIIARESEIKEAITTKERQVSDLRDAEARGRRGIVAPEFNARIAQFFPEWNFAILNKGNTGGVFANADLEVKRGQNVIARLKVRNVEQNRAVADLVPGSLSSGNRLQAGDVVVAAANQSAAQPETPKAPTPPAGGAATTAGAAQTPGAPPAPGGAPAPMSSDPFGAPAPAPAPGGAPMSSDPFGAPAPAPGAAPAPAPGAAPMGSDPFGTPAPAPGAAPAPGTTPAPAPAPAAGAGMGMGGDPFGTPPAAGTPPAGTKPAPSTADPFAPAP